MTSLRNVELSRQPVMRTVSTREVIYLIQAFNGATVRTYRTENPARALTICKPYVRSASTVQISAWVRVGEAYMIPMTYVGCSERDLAKIFEEMTRDIACAMKSSQLDEERNEEREEASREIPMFK